uniref:Uncharacterized protein n=1 Tax=Prymnesium polylepis TaxID=72548 RepID=A0A7S4JZ80_9EUKA
MSLAARSAVSARRSPLVVCGALTRRLDTSDVSVLHRACRSRRRKRVFLTPTPTPHPPPCRRRIFVGKPRATPTVVARAPPVLEDVASPRVIDDDPAVVDERGGLEASVAIEAHAVRGARVRLGVVEAELRGDRLLLRVL